MMHDNGKLAVSLQLFEHLRAQNLSASSLKLCLNILHRNDVSELLGDVYVDRQQEAIAWMYCKDLRGLCGFGSQACNRSLRKCLEQVAATGLFDWYGYDKSRRKIFWQLSSEVHLLNGTQRFSADYALIEMAHIAQLTTRLELEVYVKMAGWGNATAPAFDLSVGPRVRTKEITAAVQTIADLTDFTFFVGFIADRSSSRIDTVRIRFCHTATTWFPPAIKNWPYGTRVFKVGQGGCKEISRTDAAEYRVTGVLTKQDNGAQEQHERPPIERRGSP